MYTTSLDRARAASVEHTVPWGDYEERGGDGILAFCPAKKEPAVRWPALGKPAPGWLVDAAAASGLIALAFRWQSPMPGQAGGGGSVRLLRLAPAASRLQLLATLFLDMPPAAISLGIDRGEGQLAPASLEAPLPSAGYLLTVGFEAGGIEVSRITAQAQPGVQGATDQGIPLFPTARPLQPHFRAVQLEPFDCTCALPPRGVSPLRRRAVRGAATPRHGRVAAERAWWAATASGGPSRGATALALGVTS